MQKRSRLGQFWYICGPLIIESIIGLMVSMAASGLMLFIHFKDYMQTVMSGSQEKVMEFVAMCTNEVISYTAYIALAGSICTIPVMLFLFLRDQKRRKAEGTKAAKNFNLKKAFLLIILAGTAGLVLNNIVLLADMTIVSEAYQETSAKQFALPFVLQLVAYGIISPLCEELIFRGLIFRRMQERIPVKGAIVMSSLFFGIFHGNLIQSLYAVAMGILFAYLYEECGSFAAPLLAHVSANSIVVILTELNAFQWMFANITRMGSVTVICALAASFVFVFFFRSNGISEQGNNS